MKNEYNMRTDGERGGMKKERYKYSKGNKARRKKQRRD